ncbi:MAG: protease modulator HflC [Robiginitomaculum sp.]|nr:MAG: protease modulator HflC [Robiginitomaculum sp.]
MRSIILVVIALVALAFTFTCTYTVKQWDQALILQFGEYKRVVNAWDKDVSDAGLKFKSPLEKVIVLDRRNLELDFDPVEILDKNQNPLFVDAFVRYRITDAVQYYKSARTRQILRRNFKPVIESSLRDVLGKVDTITIVSGKRSELMSDIQAIANKTALDKGYGIEVLDVRIKKADYPDQIAQSVSNRMKADRSKEAALLRETGKEEGQRIINDARREARVILANARETAERTKGEGDGERNATYAAAYNLDPEFFAFYRSMEAYQRGLGKNTTYVLSPNSDFLRYLDNQRGK